MMGHLEESWVGLEASWAGLAGSSDDRPAECRDGVVGWAGLDRGDRLAEGLEDAA